MKRKLLFSIFLSAGAWCFAQKTTLISPVVAVKFPPSVIVRLHQVTSKVNLATNRQEALARHFMKEDSLLSTAILNGATEKEMDTIRQVLQSGFNRLFTPKELDTYFAKTVVKQAAEEAKATASFLQKKYEGDASMQQALYKLYFGQRLHTDKIFLQYQGTPLLEKHLNSNRVYDKLH